MKVTLTTMLLLLAAGCVNQPKLNQTVLLERPEDSGFSKVEFRLVNADNERHRFVVFDIRHHPSGITAWQSITEGELERLVLPDVVYVWPGLYVMTHSCGWKGRTHEMPEDRMYIGSNPQYVLECNHNRGLLSLVKPQ